MVIGAAALLWLRRGSMIAPRWSMGAPLKLRQTLRLVGGPRT